jgi:hypothetical protein
LYICKIIEFPGNVNRIKQIKYWENNEMNYAIDTQRGTNSPVLAGTFRLLLGMLMLLAGLYIWAFAGGRGEGVGLLFLIVSPFVILTDKK